MLLIRTVIRANAWRRHKLHVFIFFIFLVSNIGGALTPLGDPPLFLGFLKGVDFLWTVSAMFLPMFLLSAVLLGLFYLLDRLAWRKEEARSRPRDHDQAQLRLRIQGWRNFFLLAAALVAVLASGVWDPGIAIPFGYVVERPLQGVTRDLVLIDVSYLSWKTTPGDRAALRAAEGRTRARALDVPENDIPAIGNVSDRHRAHHAGADRSRGRA